MTSLPLTITEVVQTKQALWAVTVAFADGTTKTYLLPETMVNTADVAWSALALGQVLEVSTALSVPGSGHHQRYSPRV